VTDAARVARDLEGLVRGPVRFGRHDRMLYATDASIYQVEPIGVVVPRTIEDAERVVAYCAEQGLALLPRGGGTSLAGQAVNRAVVVDFSAHCTRLLSLDPQARRAAVEPGIVLDDLNRAAAEHGLRFGPDVATSTHATLGGMIGNNSSGAHSILYGRTVEHVEALDVLLADGSRARLAAGAAERDPRVAQLSAAVRDAVAPLAGEIRRRWPKTLRRVNGYNLDLVLEQLGRCAPGRLDALNLAGLVCGSEGTLAVVTGAHLRLVEAPRARGLAIAAFPRLDEALAALEGILETAPAAVELLDDMIIQLARQNVECARLVSLLPAPGGAGPGAVLYVEYFAAAPTDLAPRFKALRARLPRAPIVIHTDPAAMDAAWKLRRAGEPLLHSLPGERKPLSFVEDTAVDPKRLREFVERFRTIVARHGTTAAIYAHASVGCLHIRPLVNLRDPADRAAMEAISVEVTDLVTSFGGALSGEHGDGRARSHLLERFYGPAITGAFRRIKAAFDPRGRLNPGNIVDPAPMLTSLRVEPGSAAAPPVRTFFRFERERGLGAAAEACNGAGVCRRTRGGTMCPSYRALRDERHATRGRANALRLAIGGALSAGGAAAWDDPDTVATLDLCLSCKACKSECPSNVDVAKLKAEYTAQRYESAGVPRRVRALARVRPLFVLASALHGPVNLLSRLPPSAQLARLILGVDRRRSLPQFGRSLHRWMGRRKPPGGSRPAVVLLPDCFTVYGEPRVGRAAIELLEHLGYRVVLPRTGCCGRGLISGGMLREAQTTCRETALALEGALREHSAQALLACEPGCLSAIRDDWLDLDLGVDPGRVRKLAARSSLVEQFVEERWADHPAKPEPRPWTGGPVLLHAHCHQKALWGADSSGALLRRLLGGDLTVLDSGCCGMAGSFGYTPEHFDLSMQIAGLELLPALAASPAAVVAATGASCRHQVLDAAGRAALHPVEIAAGQLCG
jgi:FAD/FMN-containing dehydrogenase/Fe-S oxidoreductase